MKKLLSIFVVLLLAVSAFAQNPKLNYQAVIRDSENKLVVEQPVTVTVNVLKADNTSQFVQTLNATTNRNGLLSLEIGDETAAWSNIDWNGAKIRTAVAYDGNEMVDTAVVNSVPFALYANNVNTTAIPQSDWAETDNSKCTFVLNKPSIADTVNNILTAGNYVTTTAMDARGYLTSDSAVITTMQTNIANNTTNIATNAGNIATNASNITANTSAMESLANRVNTFNTSVCDSVTTCINNAMDARGYLTADSTVITTMQNNITTNAGTMESLANRVSTFNTNVCDSVTTCINNAMDARGYLTADSTVILTMQNNITTNASNIATNASNITANTNAMESLANRVNTFNTNVCDSVTSCINNVIDARGYLTADSTVITTMQANIANNTTNIATNAGNIATNASNITTNSNAIAAAVSKEQADSTTLAGRINALESATMDCGDVKACVADTLSKYTPTSSICNVVNTCDLSGNTSILNLLQEYSDQIDAMNAKIDSLKYIVDSLSGSTPTAAFTCGTSKVKDVDENEYTTVKIGNQCWMAQNLRTSTTTGNTYHANNDASNDETYGLLYEWTAVMQGATSSESNPSGVQGICPEGWHVPSSAEWTQLTDYVNQEANGYRCNNEDGAIGKALASTTGWNNYTAACAVGNDQSSNNATGFSAFPAGRHYGSSDGFALHAYFWSATQDESDGDYANYWDLFYLRASVANDLYYKNTGCSVRCLKD